MIALLMGGFRENTNHETFSQFDAVRGSDLLLAVFAGS
jgi:hypothetical protein